ncbi:CHASE domain-containing protein [Cognatishimia maritima]|uniref:histidine kinase n=1 Tax=Cognatishimia maritima TaxID=870908 RepID=A0A1M5RE97_9RHOB|nr:CHASE domain-containing protein [Cognatishimia maritima]SHH24349.1 Histidine kinase-, DNA gyrase B-, and HSP90-like ATPase [Cognatishimia maritima]
MTGTDIFERSTGRISALHLIIIGLSLTMTLGAWLYSKKQLEHRIESRFLAARDSTVDLILDSMSRYEDALWSGVAAISALGGDVDMQEWKVFAQSLNIDQRYPGVNGVGVIHYVPRETLPAYLAEREAERQGFEIYPQHDQGFSLPITYIEPEDVNAAAVGLDVAHEVNRRTGLLASRDTGRSKITGPIVLVQDSDHTPGFLFYAPYYSGGIPETLEERREQFQGVVYAPFVVRKLVEGLLSKERRDVHFSIRDGEQTIYDEHAIDDGLSDANPLYTDTVSLDLYGRNWEIEVRSNLAFRTNNGFEQPTLILFGGLIIEALIIALLISMARANSRARSYAFELTTELRGKSEKLEMANAEIEQFVYVASHDLKTPARGIGFLTDLMEEDLSEHVNDQEAHGALQMHLDLIRERVERMHALTRGIMDYARVGRSDLSHDNVAPEEIIKACIADFEVDTAQVHLESDVEKIVVDSHNFRRILENLIGNAFKYHPDPAKAHVAITISEKPDHLEVMVADDGAGIAPQYHERIFEVFQTLRTSEDQESTGIGLAIVKKLVEQHGGTVRVDSDEGRGACFVFQWPKTLLNERPEGLGKVA